MVWGDDRFQFNMEVAPRPTIWEGPPRSRFKKTHNRAPNPHSARRCIKRCTRGKLARPRENVDVSIPNRKIPEPTGGMVMICSWVGVRKVSTRTQESGHREEQKTRKRGDCDRQRKLRWGNIFACAEARRCASTAGGKSYLTEVAEKQATTARKASPTDSCSCWF